MRPFRDHRGAFLRAPPRYRTDAVVRSRIRAHKAMHTRFKMSRKAELRFPFRSNREHFRAAMIIRSMPRYAINPPLHVRGTPGQVIRSTDEAVNFLRATSNPDDAVAVRLVSRLETVRNPEIVQGLVKELRAWITERGLSRVAYSVK
jgi:hypothetical protein